MHIFWAVFFAFSSFDVMLFIYTLLFFSDSVSHVLLEDSDLEKNQGDGEASPVLEEEHMTEKILKCRMVIYCQSAQGIWFIRLISCHAHVWM